MESEIYSAPYEYHLNFWGGIENDNTIEKELGISEKDFWFSSEKKRDAFKVTLQDVAKKHKEVIVFSENEGVQVRFRTVVKMIMVMPGGEELPYTYDFGYAYPESSACFMWEDGNYSCDCNKSMFLSQIYPHIKEQDECGDDIELKDFKVTLEK